MKNVTNVDLNLLVVFDALMTERSVTKAGERIGLAQPSISNALSRLRAIFEDELFVRTPDGMVPTTVAKEAAEHVKTAVLAAEKALNVGHQFDPKNVEGKVVLLTNDMIELLIVPGILQALEKQAPGIRLQTKSLVREAFARDLDAGIADIALGAASEIPKRFRYVVAFEEPFACIARRGHPLLDQGLTLETFLACKHALMSTRQDGAGIVDTKLDSMNLSRKIAVNVANFASVPPLVIETDLIAVVPRRLAMKARDALPVSMFVLPFDLPTVEVKMIWGLGTEKSPKFTWLRNLIADVIAEDQYTYKPN